MQKSKVVLAGATGYLGRYMAEALYAAGYDTTLIVRNGSHAHFDSKKFNVVVAEVTQPDTLKGIMESAAAVISTVGITRQKDGLTYMDVDYQANANLLNEALANNVKRFIYVSVFNGAKMRQLKICQAKEQFVDELQNSGISECIVRPTGYFSDMRDYLTMAQKGKAYVFNGGKTRMNPIDGDDLAQVCVQAIATDQREINVGGPDVYTHRQIATIAFEVARKPIKITNIPDWVRRFALWTLRTFTSQKFYGPLEFFLTVVGMDMAAPQRGTHHLAVFFQAQAETHDKV